MNKYRNEFVERVGELRQQMEKKGIDVYIIPSADYHQSEYVGDHFKARAYISGFTGSAGTAVVTRTKAALWTDGRYFLQAEQQLRDTPFELKKTGEEGVPSIEQYIEESLPQGGVIGFDGRVISVEQGIMFSKIAGKKQGKIQYEIDLIDQIWRDRPPISKEPAFYLEKKYTGEEISHKLEKIREVLKKEKCNLHILTSLDDICWLLHIRGNDIAYSPLVLSYAVIDMEQAVLYVDENKLNDRIRESLKKNSVEICPYENIYDDVKKLSEKDQVLLDPEKVNYALYFSIPSAVKKVDEVNPTTRMKAVKNPIEIENIRNAHLKDGVAVTRFLYWLKTNIGNADMTEMSVSEKLEEFRAQQEGFISPSFAPISAYKEHAAIVHYESTPQTNVKLKAEGLLLMDTGGHYKEGTTDITRTICLGSITDKEKEHFTVVAISMLTLANAKFLSGCDGSNLDILAREPFWKRELNYNHGTGHGVGYLMNVHEGPNAFRWKNKSGANVYPLEEGMVTTDEPGIYIADAYGIRIENELLTVKGRKNAYGQFMGFEYLTFVPIDLEAIDTEMMSQSEIEMLNQYHKQVFEKISPHLNREEAEWLKMNTRSVGK